MSVSLLEQSFDRSRANDLAAFRAAQMIGGGGSDPFDTQLPISGAWDSRYEGCFEYMPRALVPEALKAIARRTPSRGAIEINLKRPTVDQKLRGAPDNLCEDTPSFWVKSALEAGIPVIRYIVDVQAKRLAIVW